MRVFKAMSFMFLSYIPVWILMVVLDFPHAARTFIGLLWGAGVGMLFMRKLKP